MKIKLSSIIDSMANRLEARGLVNEAYELDTVANAIDSDYARIEQQLEDAYKRHAPQGQIDHLETELAKYVSEGGHDISEEDLHVGVPATSEGYAIDDELRSLYHQYLNAGNKNVTPYDRQELVEIMRGAMKEGLHGQRLKPGLSDIQILEAAKDVYERHQSLNKRRENPNRMHRTPEEALKSLGDIRGRLKLKS